MKLSYDLSLTKLMILAYCRSGASEGTTLYNRTIRTSARMVGFEGNCTCSKNQGKRSSGRVFQHITEIFWLPTLLTLAQLFIFMKFFVSQNFYLINFVVIKKFHQFY